MSSRYIARILRSVEYPAWSSLVAESPHGSAYSLPDYLDALCSATGGRFDILGVFRDSELVGGLPLYEEQSRWGKALTARLLLYYNGLVLKERPSKYPSEKTSQAVQAQAAIAPFLASGYGRVFIRSRHTVNDVRPFMVDGWNVSPSYSYILELRNMATAWERVEQNLRRLVNRCEREGMQVTEDDDFSSFYRMHLDTHRRKGAYLYLGEREFQAYFERLKKAGLARLFHVRLPNTGESISAQLVLTGHKDTQSVAAAADERFLRTGATALLRWKAACILADEGYASNDLTDATLNPVTHFKAQFGGELVHSFVLTRPDRGGFRVQTMVSGLRRRLQTISRPRVQQ